MRMVVSIWICLLVIVGPAAGDTMAPAQSLPTVAVVTTGGTIAMKIDPATGAAVPALSGDALIAAVPGLAKIATLEVVQFCNIDSSWMSPELWLRLGPAVQKLVARQDVAGVVIAHGTDTMADTAYFLDLVIDTPKTVVLTGAMRNASMPGADGPANLYNAVCQAISPQAQNWGVTVTLNSYVNAASQVRKQNAMNPQTFESGLYGYLGTVYGQAVSRFNEPLHRIHLPMPQKLAQAPLLRTFVGDDGSLVRAAAAGGAQGIVVEAFGAGNVNPAVDKAIAEAIEKGIAVVVTSTCIDGGAHPEYGSTGGGAAMEKQGVILSGSLSGEKARILLSVLLGLDITQPAELRPYFN